MSPDLLPLRIAAKIEPEPMSGCWLWTAALSANGYGKVAVNGRMTTAHRLVFSLLVGPIPDGFDVDHLCRNRACVSPWHLEAVTRLVNVRRGVRGEQIRQASAERTVARCGHPLTDENTRVKRNGPHVSRACRACDNEYAKLRARRIAAAKRGSA